MSKSKNGTGYTYRLILFALGRERKGRLYMFLLTAPEMSGPPLPVSRQTPDQKATGAYVCLITMSNEHVTNVSCNLSLPARGEEQILPLVSLKYYIHGESEDNINNHPLLVDMSKTPYSVTDKNPSL